ncbi:MAG TPA: nitronate monooxygenase, partial [Ilumatobacteraceae bacterium]|nr:nitronate monooxygenase [Ilumatobacteraceae bacterium]
MRTEICDRLGIEFPIFAFSHCRDVVAAVTNAGGFGVLGALAYEPDRLEIELSWIDEHVNGKPYGVDFAMPAKYVGKGGGEEASVANLQAMVPQGHRDFVHRVLDEAGIPRLPEELEGDRRIKAAGLNVDAEGPGQMEVTISHPNVKLVVNALGPPPKYIIEMCRERGILVGGLVGAVQHAERQLALGVDVLVAQGTEAGGHCGEISTMVLVPQIVDAAAGRAAVLAAGGINDVR